ncbi:hypothetical protein JX266_007845 [Neoarthrinium moseri]|nr:hypothetical protein JX266_007845 [Neoarthrinium moseri]
MAVLGIDSRWHAGEKEIHQMLGVPEGDNPTYPGLGPQYRRRIQDSPLMAVGTLDEQGRPWTTIWGHTAGFCRPIGPGVLGAQVPADNIYDPVLHELFAVHTSDAREKRFVDDLLVKPTGGKTISALSIDLETRDRVKIAGRLVAGSVFTEQHGQADGGQPNGPQRVVQMALEVTETLGNCPKYLNKKHITPAPVSKESSSVPILQSKGTGLPLSEEAVALIQKSDLFFISSKHGDGSMDTNHRGGPPGLLGVYQNAAAEQGGVSLVYPEYSGNRLYQTLGNLRTDPYAGLVIPDFETGDALYLTGRADILIGDRAAMYLPRTKLAVRIKVEEARFVTNALSFRGEFIDHSPYNPPARSVITPGTPGKALPSSEPGAMATATLLKQEKITPTIHRFVFKLTPFIDKRGRPKSQLKAWTPGQYATFDFGPELDNGWSHMNDQEPQSLNDDFVRTFTISAPPAAELVGPDGTFKPGVSAVQLEITARVHGPATKLLSKWSTRVPLELPVLSFGGTEGFELPLTDNGKEIVFVAAGVGITPLLAQASRLRDSPNAKNILVVWSLKSSDLGLAIRAFDGIPGMQDVTALYVTGDIRSEEAIGNVRALMDRGVQVRHGRVTQDVLRGRTHGEDTGTPSDWQIRRAFYCCTGPEMMKTLVQWLDGAEVHYESFNY